MYYLKRTLISGRFFRLKGRFYMEKKVPCNVCGTENPYLWYSEDVGLVEEHYYCENCGFFIEMAYSPSIIGMTVGYDDEKEEQDKLEKREKYKDRIKELGLKCYNF